MGRMVGWGAVEVGVLKETWVRGVEERMEWIKGAS